jgi:hypothetical protein
MPFRIALLLRVSVPNDTEAKRLGLGRLRSRSRFFLALTSDLASAEIARVAEAGARVLR